jgi:methionyl-tRNA synthetase
MSDTQAKRVLVTAALPYSNGRPHVGHLAGCYLPADTYVRYLRLKEIPVRFVCGSDDHGVAIKMTAEEEGKNPGEVARFYKEQQLKDFTDCGISFDVYSSTSESPYHVEESQQFFMAIHEKGYLEKQSSQQFYDPSKEMFLPDRYVKGTCTYCDTPDQNSDQCENCGKILDAEHLQDAISTVSGNPAEIRETVHWFLDLSKSEAEVREWIESAELRDATRNFVNGLLSTGLVKRSMTRDIDWGIPVPLDDPDAKDKVLYVWFDAPIGYLSFTKELCKELDGSPDTYKDWWMSDDCEILHFIGEDNSIFHCVIWIAMLKTVGGFKLPRGVVVNQFLNMKFPGKDEEKISKSKGNAIWLGDYISSGGNPDSLRYYLTTIAPEKARTAYNPEDLRQRHNSDLGNTLGNFVNRIISFTLKYCGPEVPEIVEGAVSEVDRDFAAETEKVVSDVDALLAEYSFKTALERIMEFARDCNKYVDTKEPWQTRKTDMEVTKVSLRYALNAIHTLSVVLSPYLPETVKKMQAAFGKEQLLWKDALIFPEAGAALSKPEILFEKIDVES